MKKSKTKKWKNRKRKAEKPKTEIKWKNRKRRKKPKTEKLITDPSPRNRNVSHIGGHPEPDITAATLTAPPNLSYPLTVNPQEFFHQPTRTGIILNVYISSSNVKYLAHYETQVLSGADGHQFPPPADPSTARRKTPPPVSV